ncbi:MAG: tRNA (adenosine(37)-N6)-threonylcarbamoyltransferase complex dimerization subunit type 1 TsaB [Pseudomonadota bacterium]
MKLLAIDTSTEACSAALWLDGEVRERFELTGREHTQKLMPQVASLMAECGVSYQQLDGIVCGHGPGSFAGVRIGVGYVKGLGLALDRPVLGVSSLAMLALRAAREHAATQVLSAIDARMNEVYFGAFEVIDGKLRALAAEVVVPPAAIPAMSAGRWLAAGTGWGTYREALSTAAAVELSQVLPEALPHAGDALLLAVPEFAAGRAINADALAPVYLRNKVALTLVEQAALRK